MGLFHTVCSINQGWRSYIKENSDEFHDLPLTWDLFVPPPSWLNGTYVRNGPAQISFGSPRRHLNSWLEGFAKLHSFKMSGDQVLYSGKMMESPNYMASREMGELVPMLTLNKFANPEDEWTWWEKLQILSKAFTGDTYGNNNPALWRIGPKDDGIYMAVTDSHTPTQFNLSTLDTVGQQYPPSYPITLSGCAHFMREPGTDNSINFNYKKGFTGAPWVDVMRYRPQDSYQYPEVIASFTPTKFSYIHSFSVTEHYVILMFYPVVISRDKFKDSNFHIFECIEANDKTDTTDIFVIHLQTGEVMGPFHSDWMYAIHHINAYENTENEIILDLCPAPYDFLWKCLLMDKMMNPPEDEDSDANECNFGHYEITRYNINLKSGDVTHSTFPNTIKSRYINNFEFPTINEAYRGKKYCITYGASIYAYSRTALVKKNVCNPDEDKVYYLEDHYMSEMFFLPAPDSSSEDDGVLITLSFDGTREQSYLLLLDAATFLPINKAFLPHNIPWSAHGMYFPEGKFREDEEARIH